MWLQKGAPPVRLLTYNINNFNGGLNNHSVITSTNEASEMMNMTFHDQIVLEKRKGSMLYNATLHNEVITHLDEYKPYTETAQIVRAGLSTIRFDNNGSITSYSLTGSRGVDGENFQGRYFFCDGDKIRVYGKFPQATVSPYIRVVGTPNANYTTLSVASTPASYTALDTSHTRGVTVYDYTAGTVYYEPCTNEKTSAYLGLSVVPTGIRYIASLRGRLYVSGNDADDDNVFISHVGNPYYFPPSLPLQVPPNSDKITGLIVYDDAVVVGRQHDLHIITGRTNNPDLGVEMFALTKLNTHTGFISNKSANVAHNFLFYVGYDGNCYALSSARQDAKVLATSILNKKLEFKALPFLLTDALIQTAVSHFQNGIWYVSIGDYVFAYHYEVQAWTVYNNLFIRSFYNKDGLMMWGNKWNQTCKWSEDYLDEANTTVRHPIHGYWTSGIMDFGDAFNQKQFRDMFIVAHAFTASRTDIRIVVEIDYKPSTNYSDVYYESARWGVAKFGQQYSQNPINTSAPFTINERARTIRIKLSNCYELKGTYATSVPLVDMVGVKEGDMYYISGEDKYFVFHNGFWDAYDRQIMNQPMRVYQINGEYQFKGRR